MLRALEQFRNIYKTQKSENLQVSPLNTPTHRLERRRMNLPILATPSVSLVPKIIINTPPTSPPIISAAQATINQIYEYECECCFLFYSLRRTSLMR